MTHTKQPLRSVSYLRVLEAAEKASRWEKGAPVSRGGHARRSGGDGVRAPCALGARFESPQDDTASEVA